MSFSNSTLSCVLSINEVCLQSLSHKDSNLQSDMFPLPVRDET